MKDGMRWGWEWGVANPLPPGRGGERPEKGWEGSVLCGIKVDFWRQKWPMLGLKEARTPPSSNVAWEWDSCEL